MAPIQHVLRDAAFADLEPATLYAILRLRSDVFVVEQDCAYPDLDGRDTEADARHLWAEHDGEVLSALRLLVDADDCARIGRVVTAPTARGAGLAAELMARAVELAGGRPIVLNAQAHLAGWYERFGFGVAGGQFDEDGIAHVPMRRPTLPAMTLLPTLPDGPA